MRLVLLAALMLVGCGGQEVFPANYTAPVDGGTDAGCVFEGEDGAQFAPSTVEWWMPSCQP